MMQIGYGNGLFRAYFRPELIFNYITVFQFLRSFKFSERIEILKLLEVPLI